MLVDVLEAGQGPLPQRETDVARQRRRQHGVSGPHVGPEERRGGLGRPAGGTLRHGRLRLDVLEDVQVVGLQHDSTADQLVQQVVHLKSLYKHLASTKQKY